jgi:hypothetical protein
MYEIRLYAMKVVTFHFGAIKWCIELFYPVPMAARSKARTAFNRSNTGIIGLNPARDMDMCVFAFLCVVLSCVGRDQRWADPPSKES